MAAAVSGIACSSSGNTVADDGGSGSSTGSGGGSTTGSGTTGSSTGSGTTGSSTGSGTTGSSTGSSTSGSTTGSSTGASTGSTGPVDSGGPQPTSDGGCPTQTMGVVAVKVTIPVGWPSSTAGNSGEGDIYIWFLTTLNLPMGSTMYMGSTRSCGTTLPDLTLNTAGSLAVGAGSVMNPKIQLAILPATFDAITRTFMTNGTQSGWGPGDTITETKTLGGLGLAPGSKYMMEATAWPPDCAMSASSCNSTGSFAASDLQDDDGDMQPGITVTPNSTSPYFLPPTALSLGGQALKQPAADKVYIALRQEIALSGMRTTDCQQGSGTATITLFDNHVVGCHATASSSAPAGNCTSAQASFLDANRTKYTVKGTEMASSPSAISPSNPVMGTFTLKQISNTATCADARAALP
ncbi:MAG TPA: hypothetical protein VKU41_19480 [Polyangiaceae bacterium]|nr:hypothetical protein [Polyangiaceae bacterium]